ncbi:MAG TPA: hypothetical protein VNM22_09555 [Candidatus Limnocylindrales bacterium]|nr:hypothetical protein [Candidatus Limnocylindrales bacterium]
MYKVHYKLSIGDWMVNSQDDLRTEFITLELNHSTNLPADTCRISIYAPPAPQPGLLEQAVSAAASALGFGNEEKEESFSIQVRGKAIKQGDRLTVELTAGDRSGKVMTADVQSIESSFGQTKIVGTTGKQKLASTRINQVYENQTLRQIVENLSRQAEVETGEIETGSSYPYFIAHESKNLLKHICELAMRDGLDAYFDTDNKLTLKKFNKSNPDHTFYFGIDILDLRISHYPVAGDPILVYGESPASQQGADTWHWIAKDLSPFQSEVGQGKRTLSLQDGTIRTKDAADRLATSKFGAIKDYSTWGQMKILGNPKVKLADAIEIKNAQKPELNGLFKVISVGHVFNKQQGYLTFIGFTGQGGAEKAGNLLNQLAGKLAGALGL